MPLIELFATFFGVLCVWLTIKQNIWCWPAGIIQVALFISIFYDAHLYSDLLLHIIYVFLNLYGWYHWLKPPSNSEELKITLLGKSIFIWITICIVATIGMAVTMSSFTNASLPYPDSFIAIASLIAQWLMTKKKLESWYFWLSVDVFAIGVYWMKGLYITTGLYALFLILAAIGFFEWRKKFLQSQITPLL